MIYSTFNEYLTKPKSLTFEEMQELHDMILADISDDMDGKELYEELIQTAVRYAGIRAEWCLLDREKKAERDSVRTACHDSVIRYAGSLSGNAGQRYRMERQAGRVCGAHQGAEGHAGDG